MFQVYNEVEHPVCYFSCELNRHQINYSIVEKEVLSLIFAVRMFLAYFGSNSVIVFSDHAPLQFLSCMSNYYHRLLR